MEKSAVKRQEENQRLAEWSRDGATIQYQFVVVATHKIFSSF